MGKVLSLMARPFRNFNIESRAHKAIAKEARSAPKRPKEAEHTKQMLKEYPEAFKESLQKNPLLDQHLKGVYITSEDVQAAIKKPSNLPTNRNALDGFELPEPENVPPGKVTLKKAIEFITNHQTDALNYPISRIVQEQNLPEETVRTILRYCRVLEMYVPDKNDSKATFFGPYIPRKIVKEITVSSTEEKT